MSSDVYALVSAIENASDPEIYEVADTEHLVRLAVAEFVLSKNALTASVRAVDPQAAQKIIDRNIANNIGASDPRTWFSTIATQICDFLDLAYEGVTTESSVAHLDLLPIGHPQSIHNYGLTASARTNAVAEWLAADPRISSERARSAVYEAYLTTPGSIESQYATAKLEALCASGEVPTEYSVGPLIAAFNMSFAERSAMSRILARIRHRDRKGRFANEFGRLRGWFKKKDGSMFSATGRIAGSIPGTDKYVVEYKNDPNIPDGLYPQEASKSENVKATLSKRILAKAKPTASSDFSQEDQDSAVSFDDFVATKLDTPPGWSRDKDGNLVSETGNTATEVSKLPKGNYMFDGLGENNEPDMGEPIFEIKNKDGELIGAAQDWAGIQKIALTYDELKNDNGGNEPPKDSTPAPSAPEEGEPTKQVKDLEAGDTIVVGTNEYKLTKKPIVRKNREDGGPMLEFEAEDGVHFINVGDFEGRDKIRLAKAKPESSEDTLFKDMKEGKAVYLKDGKVPGIKEADLPDFFKPKEGEYRKPVRQYGGQWEETGYVYENGAWRKATKEEDAANGVTQGRGSSPFNKEPKLLEEPGLGQDVPEEEPAKPAKPLSEKQMEPATPKQYALLKELQEERDGIDENQNQAINDALEKQNLSKAQMAALFGDLQKKPFKPEIDPNKPTDRMINSLRDYLTNKELTTDELNSALDELEAGLDRAGMEKLLAKLRRRPDKAKEEGFGQDVPSDLTPQDLANGFYFDKSKDGETWSAEGDDNLVEVTQYKGKWFTRERSGGNAESGYTRESEKQHDNAQEAFEYAADVAGHNWDQSLFEDLRYKPLQLEMGNFPTMIGSRFARDIKVGDIFMHNGKKRVAYGHHGWYEAADGIDDWAIPYKDESGKIRLAEIGQEQSVEVPEQDLGKLEQEPDGTYIYQNNNAAGIDVAQNPDGTWKVTRNLNESLLDENVAVSGEDSYNYPTKAEALAAANQMVDQFDDPDQFHDIMNEAHRFGDGLPAFKPTIEEQGLGQEAPTAPVVRKTVRDLKPGDSVYKINSYEIGTIKEVAIYQDGGAMMFTDGSSQRFSDRQMVSQIQVVDLNNIAPREDAPQLLPTRISKDDPATPRQLEYMKEQLDGGKLPSNLEQGVKYYLSRSDELGKKDASAFVGILKNNEAKQKGEPAPAAKGPNEATDAQYGYVSSLLNSKEVPEELATAAKQALDDRNLTKAQIGEIIGKLRNSPDKEGYDPNAPTERMIESVKRNIVAKGLSQEDQESILQDLPNMDKATMSELIGRLKAMDDVNAPEEGLQQSVDDLDAEVEDIALELDTEGVGGPFISGNSLRRSIEDFNNPKYLKYATIRFQSVNEIRDLAADIKDGRLSEKLNNLADRLESQLVGRFGIAEVARTNDEGDEISLSDVKDSVEAEKSMYFETDTEKLIDHLNTNDSYGDVKSGGAEIFISQEEDGTYTATVDYDRDSEEFKSEDRDEVVQQAAVAAAEYNQDVIPSSYYEDADLEKEAEEAKTPEEALAFADKLIQLADDIENNRGDRDVAYGLKDYAERIQALAAKRENQAPEQGLGQEASTQKSEAELNSIVDDAIASGDINKLESLLRDPDFADFDSELREEIQFIQDSAVDKRSPSKIAADLLESGDILIDAVEAEGPVLDEPMDEFRDRIQKLRDNLDTYAFTIRTGTSDQLERADLKIDRSTSDSYSDQFLDQLEALADRAKTARRFSDKRDSRPDRFSSRPKA
jgi:polyhydroxyalkanoate synthesis regulator phasin